MSWLILGVLASNGFAADALQLFPGYVTKVSCQGRLLVSSLGNDTVVRLEALPKELGCAVLLKPLVSNGRTNLILETSSGSSQVTLDIRPGQPSSKDLRREIKGDRS